MILTCTVINVIFYVLYINVSRIIPFLDLQSSLDLVVYDVYASFTREHIKSSGLNDNLAVPNVSLLA